MKNKPIAIVHNCLYCLKPIAEAGEGTCWGCLPYTLKGIILRTEVGDYDSRPKSMVDLWGSVQHTLEGLAELVRRRHGVEE